MSQSGHFTVNVRCCEPELNVGKHLYSSAGKMHVCPWQPKRHTHACPAKKPRSSFARNPSVSFTTLPWLFKAPLTCTTTTWMDTWSGSRIGARKYWDNATRRWSMATRLLAWTAARDIKSTSYKLQSNWGTGFYSCLDAGMMWLFSSGHLEPGDTFKAPHPQRSPCNMSGCHRLVEVEI